MRRLDEIEARANAATSSPKLLAAELRELRHWAREPERNDETEPASEALDICNRVDDLRATAADVPWLVARLRQAGEALTAVPMEHALWCDEYVVTEVFPHPLGDDAHMIVNRGCICHVAKCRAALAAIREEIT